MVMHLSPSLLRALCACLCVFQYAHWNSRLSCHSPGHLNKNEKPISARHATRTTPHHTRLYTDPSDPPSSHGMWGPTHAIHGSTEIVHTRGQSTVHNGAELVHAPTPTHAITPSSLLKLSRSCYAVKVGSRTPSGRGPRVMHISSPALRRRSAASTQRSHAPVSPAAHPVYAARLPVQWAAVAAQVGAPRARSLRR